MKDTLHIFNDYMTETTSSGKGKRPVRALQVLMLASHPIYQGHPNGHHHWRWKPRLSPEVHDTILGRRREAGDGRREVSATEEGANSTPRRHPVLCWVLATNQELEFH